MLRGNWECFNELYADRNVSGINEIWVREKQRC